MAKGKMIIIEHSENEKGYLPIAKLTPEQTVNICDENLSKTLFFC